MKSQLFYRAIFFAICLTIELDAISKNIHANDSTNIERFDSTFEVIYSLFNLPNVPQNKKDWELPLLTSRKLNTSSWPNISS